MVIRIKYSFSVGMLIFPQLLLQYLEAKHSYISQGKINIYAIYWPIITKFSNVKTLFLQYIGLPWQILQCKVNISIVSLFHYTYVHYKTNIWPTLIFHWKYFQWVKYRLNVSPNITNIRLLLVFFRQVYLLLMHF